MTHRADPWQRPPTQLFTLPPVVLLNQRRNRYGGGTFATPLAQFAPADQRTLRDVYGVLGVLWTTLTTPPTVPLHAAVGAVLTRADWPALVQHMQDLGTATPDPTLDLVIHDLRGGNFTALVGVLSLVERSGGAPRALPTLVVLVRDHLHAMRNLVPDLDVAGAAADTHPQPQSTERLVEKWRYGPTQVDEHLAQVHLDVAVHAAIAARPSELAAMDAVLTNLVNNAARFAADAQVYLAVLPHPAGHDVRVVVANRLHATQAQTLTERFGTDWRRLFAGGFTTGGTGMGLRICAAYVAECYGLAGTQQAVAAQHLGATLIETAFVAWFHWPLLGAAGA